MVLIKKCIFIISGCCKHCIPMLFLCCLSLREAAFFYPVFKIQIPVQAVFHAPASQCCLFKFFCIPRLCCICNTNGKNSLMLFDRHPEYRDRYGRHFWARGYYCETVGNVNEATIKKYIDEQYENDRLEGES